MAMTTTTGARTTTRRTLQAWGLGALLAGAAQVAHGSSIEASLGPEIEAGLERMVPAILDADFVGDREALAVRADGLACGETRVRSKYLAYWRGFAHWRRALNGFNLTPWPGDLAADYAAAEEAFRAALALDPDWTEAKVGLAFSLGGHLFLVSRSAAEGGGAAASDETRARLEARAAEYRRLVGELGPERESNPRVAWLAGASYLFSPPPQRDLERAAATYRRGLDAARAEALGGPRAPWEPSWGRAELLMSLAYLYSRPGAEDRPLALAYAAGALALAPHWHYVGAILVPQIEALPTSK